MDLGLTERVAIVGDASHEVGRHIATTLAAEGARVSLHSPSEEGLRRTEMEVARIGSQHSVLAIPADPSQERDIRRVVRDTVNRFGQIDILVVPSGSGVHPANSEPEEGSETAELEASFFSALRFSREVVPYMKQEHWGRIIYLESPPSRPAGRGVVLWADRHLHLVGYFKILARELAPFNITVNSLVAGLIATHELEQWLAAQSHAEQVGIAELKGTACAGIPMGRMGKPQEIGDMIAFLASERAGYLTGAAISVDGGHSQGFL